MKGAICGDVIGSRFEGVRHNTTKKDFKLIAELNGRGQGSKYTDDSYFTIAVADALMSLTDDEIKKDEIIINRIAEYFIKYRDIDKKAVRYCGRQFKEWLYSEKHEPYNGWSNGAVMRCSPAGFIAKSADEAYRLGGLTAMPTHNSNEAVKAASVLAEAIYLLRNGTGKEDIKLYFLKHYELPSLQWVSENSKIHIESDEYLHCNLSSEYALKAAMVSFLESDDFESAIRIAVLLGGDSDTIACITGALAECFYGVPEDIWNMVKSRLSQEMIEVVDKFYNR